MTCCERNGLRTWQGDLCSPETMNKSYHIDFISLRIECYPSLFAFAHLNLMDWLEMTVIGGWKKHSYWSWMNEIWNKLKVRAGKVYNFFHKNKLMFSLNIVEEFRFPIFERTATKYLCTTFALIKKYLLSICYIPGNF